jgi:hypothetical protein
MEIGYNIDQHLCSLGCTDMRKRLKIVCGLAIFGAAHVNAMDSNTHTPTKSCMIVLNDNAANIYELNGGAICSIGAANKHGVAVTHVDISRVHDPKSSNPFSEALRELGEPSHHHDELAQAQANALLAIASLLAADNGSSLMVLRESLFVCMAQNSLDGHYEDGPLFAFLVCPVTVMPALTAAAADFNKRYLSVRP